MNTIQAKEGRWLTQEILDDESQRVYIKGACSSDLSNWRDASNEEKEWWENKHKDDVQEDVDSIEYRLTQLEKKSALAEALYNFDSNSNSNN